MQFPKSISETIAFLIKAKTATTIASDLLDTNIQCLKKYENIGENILTVQTAEKGSTDAGVPISNGN